MPMSRRRFCSSWSKVLQLFAQSLAYFHASSGFGEFSDEGEVAFWTGILGV